MNVGQYRCQPLPVINSKVSAPGVQQLAHGHLPKTFRSLPADSGHTACRLKGAEVRLAGQPLARLLQARLKWHERKELSPVQVTSM